MAFVCDFSVIQDDDRVQVPEVEGNAEVPLSPFNTEGRDADRAALLFLSVRNLATGNPHVHINGDRVGTINRTNGATWSTQLIHFSGARLRDGNNEIVLKDVTDEFDIKDVVCFFHQSA